MTTATHQPPPPPVADRKHDRPRVRQNGERDRLAGREFGRIAGWITAAGVASLLFGILVLSINWDVASLSFFVGVIFAIRGVGDLLTSAAAPSLALAIASGIAGIAFGILAIAWPGPTLLVLATLTGLWLIIGGATEIVASIMHADVDGWWLHLVAGLIALPLGVWSLGHPGATLNLIIAVVGIWAIAAGLARIILGIELRSAAETHLGDVS